MDPSTAEQVTASPAHHDLLLQTNSLIHISCTGAGPELQRAIWGTPGCSAYFAGCFTPYRRTQTHSFLGHPPEDSYCELEVAYDMAMASYLRASEVVVEEDKTKHPIGIGVSAAVASDRLPRGDQRAHIVIITKDHVCYQYVPLRKDVGAEARHRHDVLIAQVTVQLLCSILDGSIPNSEDHEALALERFYRYPIFYTNGTRRRPDQRERGLYLPATLNPITDGHRAMCHAAEDLLSPPEARIRASYLVSSVSPHKGRLSVQEMLFKAGMLRAERWHHESRAVEFTRDEPLFLDKARKRPASTFIIGADTMERMLDPTWGVEIEPMLHELKTLGTKFLVMGRLDKLTGKWVTCRDIKVHYLHQNLFEPLPGRVDISSTELRGTP